ncbi:hypothetical protein CFC21_065078 [Triticum aestivum]|nr:phytosulfokines 2-like [Triticum dicoccoides]XP_044380436.1 phytosulfokines 2 [Triticum aestivum]XP_048550394.1 phytosulfokines 2-like [Triticum urartu]VAI15544.1 unnamed protein product [Triticum turgidum subsp. durum]ABG66636.1 phytosulfokine-alpha 1 precursor [Triticum aestivum]ABG66639.1 phytosulfokine-alpha 1 precursor [Triticum aestivum]KAF7057927.1 hypothetical protein CFC21_065078 [Triticum aestivum]
MTRRCSPPLAALVLLLLLCFSYGVAAARPLPANTAPHQGIGVVRVKAEDAAATDGLVVLKEEGGKAGNGGEAVSPSEATVDDATAEEEACEEGKEGEECMQRRLLHDAHLDYIYTQHKGRP